MELTHADVMADGLTFEITFSDGYRAAVLRRSGVGDAYRVAVREALETRGIYGQYVSMGCAMAPDGRRWRFSLLPPPPPVEATRRDDSGDYPIIVSVPDGPIFARPVDAEEADGTGYAVKWVVIDERDGEHLAFATTDRKAHDLVRILSDGVRAGGL